MLYTIEFERANYNFKPPLSEKVTVILETETPYENESIEQFESEVWDALFVQYPIWRCPYHASHQPPNRFEHARHSWSSPLQGKVRRIG